MYIEPSHAPAGAEAHSNGLIEYLQLLRSSKLLSAMCIAAGLLIAAAVTYLQTPVYEAKSYLEFQSIKTSDEALGIKDSGLDLSPESYLQTQIKVLQSRSLAKRVHDRLMKDHPNVRYIPRNRLAQLARPLGLFAGSRAKAATPPVEAHAKVVDGSRVIEIVCDSPDPQFAMLFANTMANEYIDYNIEALWDSAKRTETWLTKQLSQIKEDLERSEAELQAYSQQFGLYYSGAQTVDDEKLKQVQTELSGAQADRIAKQAAFEMSTSTSADAIPQVLDNGRLSEQQRKIADLRLELADLSSIYTPQYSKVVRIQAQLTELEATYRREKQNILSRIDSEYQGAVRRERLLTTVYADQLAKLSQTNRTEIYYGILKREVDSESRLYDQLLQKTKAIGVSSASQTNNLRVLDPAEAPTKPTKPDPVHNILIGAICGLAMAVGLVIGREFIDRSLRAPGESEFHLRVPELGVIPEYQGVSHLKEINAAPSTTPEATGSPSLELMTWQDRPSAVAESYRSALASIMASGNGSAQGRVLMVTSGSRREGKSSSVSNLGLALAEINQRVLLIDADMRKPHLHEIFDVPNSWGLSDLLRERSPLETCPLAALARKTEIADLYILPSGPGTLSISNLLYSNRMSSLIQRLRKEFDVVIIDTPPMLHISDARILGRLADGAILILRASRTTREAARTVKQRLVDDGIPVIGTILNGWDLKAKTRYGPTGYY
ncbi:MAG: polysaccharide biosynthesis tyrosine autokinase [Candidatus Solibacter sp.]